MATEEGLPAVDEPYLVNCHNCQTQFDALASFWCDCLTNESTLVCSQCLTCFCKAPAGYKKRFWENAPQQLWDKKWAKQRAAFEPKPNPAPQEVKRPLVLLVEDEKDIQRVASEVIEALGYGLVLARNGMEGLALAAEYQPDLVLSDAMMPKMDGREMCRQIKAEPATAHIKTVIMTSLYTHVKYKIEAYKNFQVDDYLSKPLDFEQLRTILQKHLGNSAPVDE